MTWTRLCGAGDIAENSMAMFTVNGVDVVLIKAGGGYLAVAPLCGHMKEPLVNGRFDECFDQAVPACNRYLRESLGKGGGPVGVAEAPMSAYETQVVDGGVYVDPEARRPLQEYQHMTCSPIVGPDGVQALIVNLWRAGLLNEREVVLGACRA